MAILLLGAACAESREEPMKLPPEPTPEEVIRDLKEGNSTLLGRSVGAQPDEPFPLLTLIVEEEEIAYTTGEAMLTAEIAAYIGDEQWRSVDKKTVRLRYELDEDRDAWQLSGQEIGDSIVAVAVRDAASSADATTGHRGG
ncbi:hypothetical protein PA598K_06812 [Paenibacillus sp. 598K]|nr:hypothetical protein PA598K_06812 [Paenibacillus sp. 598K]